MYKYMHSKCLKVKNGPKRTFSHWWLLTHILNEVTYCSPESTDDLHDSVVASTMELILQPLAVRVIQGHLQGEGKIRDYSEPSSVKVLP